MDDLITISSSSLPDTTRVVAFRGTEALSRPYELEIFIALNNGEGESFDLGDSIGAKATMTLDRASDKLPPFYFSAVLASVELLHELDGFSLIRAVMVPKLWLLGLSKHSRIFTKMALPDIIKSVLEDNGLSGDDFELRLGKYETEEHVCQYRESDLDFLSRWMEREGIFYFFEHTDSGEKLILCDNKAYEEDPLGEPVPYHPQLGQDRSAGASFRTFTCRHKTLPAKIKLKDYDYAKPNLNVAGSANVSPNGTGEVSLYGERFFSPSAGDRLAKLRAEEMLARQVLFHATGTRLHLRTGYTFDLEEHPRAAFNARYLTIEARHWGNQGAGHEAFRKLLELEHDDVYCVELTAIPGKTQFRAETRTPWPRIYGYENGTVDGAADSEYAQIDDQGRYNVKFKFDESNLKGAKASTYVRMMQPHGGGIEGFHFPLRKGTEVLFSFMGGDPDRPVITGVVPNALTPSPVTSGNHTKNVIQTGGRNRLELEDKAGQQRVTLSTPYSNTYLRMGSPNEDHELIVRTDDNTLLDAGKQFDLTVGQNGGGTWNATIKTDWITHVQEGIHQFFVDTGTSETTVNDAVTELYKNGQSTTIQAANKKLAVASGGYFLGIANGYGMHVNGGASFIVNNGAGVVESAHSPGFYIQVNGEGYTMYADKHVHVESKTDSMHVWSQTEMNIKSKTAKVKIEAPADDIEILTPGKKVKIDCTTFEDTSQDKKSCWGSISDLAKGKWTILKLADFFEMGISAKMEISASIAMALSFSIKASMEFGLGLQIGAGAATIKMSNAKLDSAAVRIKNALGPCLTNAAFRLSRGTLQCYI